MRRRLPIARLLLLLSAPSALASPQFFTRHDIHTGFDGPRSLYATHVDADGDIEIRGVDIGEYLYEWKGQEVVVSVAPLFPALQMPTFCDLCGTWYDGDVCPMRRAERDEAKRVIEERLRRDREEKDNLICREEDFSCRW